MQVPGDVPFIRLKKAINMAAQDPRIVGSWGVMVFTTHILTSTQGADGSGKEISPPFTAPIVRSRSACAPELPPERDRHKIAPIDPTKNQRPAPCTAAVPGLR